MNPRRIAAFAVLAVALALPLVAHELGLVEIDAMFRKDGTYTIDFLVHLDHLAPGQTAASIADKAVLSFDGKPFPHDPAQVLPHPGDPPMVQRLRISGRTPPNVSRFTFADDQVVGYYVLTLHNESQPNATTQWVEGGKASEPYPLDRSVVPASRWQIVKLYLILGFTHILPRGLDHVLFVLGIFLLAVNLRAMMWQVSAFTVAHTITLALTIYGVVSLPARIVEPLIALSIVYVAVENVFTSRLHAWRPLIVFGFGLLHGMGFAGVLTEIGLPRSEFVPALLSFNVGVECGQLTVILTAFLLVGLPFRRKAWYRQRIVIPASLGIATMGLFWFIQRVM